MSVSKALQQLMETHHYVAPGWSELDRPPEETTADGKPWWDTPDTARDPEASEDQLATPEARKIQEKVAEERPRDLSQAETLADKAKRFLRKRKG